MRRPILIIATVVGLASLLAGGTFAFFTANSVSASVITAGNVGVNLVEYQRSATGTLEPFAQDQRIAPASTVSLEPVAQNTKDQPIWVRMRASVVIVMPDGTERRVSGAQYVDAELDETTGEVVALDFNTTHWTYRDGYWYYDGALQAGAAAEPLFSHVTFSPDMESEFQGAVFRVDLRAQCVQAAHTGNDALDAIGWPEE